MNLKAEATLQGDRWNRTLVYWGAFPNNEPGVELHFIRGGRTYVLSLDRDAGAKLRNQLNAALGQMGQ